MQVDTVLHGDALEVLRKMPDNSVDSIVTDPPAGIAFMGKEWDNPDYFPLRDRGERLTGSGNPTASRGFANNVHIDNSKRARDAFIHFLTSVMTEALRVLKPGGHALVWALPRTSHWTATALEDAGYEIREKLYHCFGSGFPKSLDVAKAAQKGGLACACQKSVIYSHHEDMYDMRQGMDAAQPIPSKAQFDLQQGMQRQAYQHDKEGQAVEASTLHDMPALQQGISTNQQPQNSQVLQLRMRGATSNTATSIHGTSQDDSAKYEGQNKTAAIWSEQSSVEGWSNVETSEGQLQGRSLREMSSGISNNGSQGWLYNGASVSDGSTSRAHSQQNGSSTSHRPQSEQQSYQQPPTIPQQRSAQTCGRCGKPIIQEGLGTATKPAVEEWILVRKPLSEHSIAAQVLATGTGGLNIDACRVGWESGGMDGQERTSPRISPNPMDWGKGEVIPRDYKPNTQGRFPSHLLMSHSIFCVPLGTKRVRGNAPQGKPSLGKDIPRTSVNAYTPQKFIEGCYADQDGYEQVEAYDCHESCPIAELDRQSGVRKSGGRTTHKGDVWPVWQTNTSKRGKDSHRDPDTGTASRYFTNFPPSDFVPFVSTGLYSVPCCLLCNAKNDIMDKTKSKESTISCNTIVPTAANNSSQNGATLNTAQGSVQEKLQPENEGKNQSHSTPANHAESNGWNTQAITANSAQLSAWGLDSVQLAQLVKDAVNLCDSCATAIAQSLVRAKPKTDHLSLHGLEFITETNASILRQNLVAYVDHLESTDTTPTIANLTKLFGFVQHAIKQNTIRARSDISDGLDQLVPYKYVAKASRRERNAGCDGLPEHNTIQFNERMEGQIRSDGTVIKEPIKQSNHHPTVKPLSLMRWLIRLITPPDGIVLDMFGGSGSTGVAAIQEGKHFILIEQDESYVNIAQARIAHAWQEQGVTAQEYECSEDCPIAILEAQSKGTRADKPSKSGKGGWRNEYVGGDTTAYMQSTSYEDSKGGAARFFQQFPPDSLFAECDEVAI